MARLITTGSEKQSASFLDWDDAALGSMCKKVALLLQNARRKKRAAGVKDDDLQSVINAADGILLVAGMIESNAASLDLTFGDFTHNGSYAGDWRIRIEHLGNKRK